jgi:hypothetical protein
LGYQQQEYQMIQILRYWDLCAEDMDPRYAGRRSRNQFPPNPKQQSKPCL